MQSEDGRPVAAEMLTTMVRRMRATTGHVVAECEVWLDGPFTVAKVMLRPDGGHVLQQFTGVGVAKFNPNDTQLKVGKHSELVEVSCYNAVAGIRRAIHRALKNALKEAA